MQPTVHRIDRQPQATIGNHWQGQGDLPLVGIVPALQMLPLDIVRRATFSGTLAEAARHSGLDDHEIADAIHVCHGYMSRLMRTVGQQWAKRIVAFMRHTGSLAPLQWLADQMGCDVAPRAQASARIRELEAELQQLRRPA